LNRQGAALFVRAAAEPGARTTWFVEGFMLLAWLLPMTFAVLAHTDLKAISSDELAMYRYTSDILAYLRDDLPIAWGVPMGPRDFPDLAISFAAYGLSLGNPRAWGAIFALLNLALVYGAFRLLLKVAGVDPAERRLGALLFMAVLLLLTAISFQGGVNLLRTTYHNTMIAPALLFCALPMLGTSVRKPQHSAALVAGLGIFFGFVIHSDPLFLPWSVVPALATALVMTVVGGISWRGMATAIGVTLVALALAQALRLGFDALPFLDYQDRRLTRPIELTQLAARLSALRQAYASYGGTSVLLLYLLAAASGALSLWATLRGPGKAWRFRLFVSLLFMATALAVPAAMLVKNLLSLRYLFWGIAVAAVPIALGIADILSVLRVRSAAAGLATALLLISTPFFMVRARDVALRQTPEDALIAALDAEAAAGRIGRTGLAHYWVAHKLAVRSDMTVAPVGLNANPFFLNGNAFRFWDWRSGCPKERRFTFVIGAHEGAKKVLPAAIRARFGAPAAIVPVSGSGFEIWRYPGGIPAPDAFYRLLVNRLEKRGLSIRALDRCAKARDR
jgi:hypothetical protein